MNGATDGRNFTKNRVIYIHHHIVNLRLRVIHYFTQFPDLGTKYILPFKTCQSFVHGVFGNFLAQCILYKRLVFDLRSHIRIRYGKIIYFRMQRT